MLEFLQQRLAERESQHLTRRMREASSPTAPRQTVDGQPRLLFCSNDYLGLASHPRVVKALQEGARIWGGGSGGAALISGHSTPHRLLEERLAAWAAPHIPGARALSFGTGYMANLAVVSALGLPGAALFCEALNHASLIDGARLARADKHVYRNLDELRAQLQASSAAHKVIVSDAVFSMDGHLAPLPELLQLAEAHHALLVVDDAHGFGVLGERGHGSLSHFGLKSERLVWMGTLGKAAGVAGAFVAAHPTVIDWLLQTARPYIFTTAAPPLLAHALLTSLDLIEGKEGERRRAQLDLLREHLRDGLAPLVRRAGLDAACERHAHSAGGRRQQRGGAAACRSTRSPWPARTRHPPAHRRGGRRTAAHHPVRRAPHRGSAASPASPGMTRLFFVTGTDTEIGKTTTTAALTHWATQQGLRAAGLKPVAAGQDCVDGHWSNEDVRALHAAQTVGLSEAEVGAIQLRTPCAPHLAARLEGTRIDRAAVMAATRAPLPKLDLAFVEGVGGWRVPLDEEAGWDSADWAQELAAPVILVVGLRLGCINHALLTAECVAARGLKLAGWVANTVDGTMLQHAENVATLKNLLAAPCLGQVPRLQHPTPSNVAAYLDAAALKKVLLP